MSSRARSVRMSLGALAFGLFLTLFADAAHAQNGVATHSGTFELKGGSSLTTIYNPIPSPGPHRVLVTICVTDGGPVAVATGQGGFTVFNGNCETALYTNPGLGGGGVGLNPTHAKGKYEISVLLMPPPALAQ